MAKNPLGAAPVRSGLSPGTNGDLWSQSGGIARTFQGTNGSAGLRTRPTTNGRAIGTGGTLPGVKYAIFGPGGNSSQARGKSRSVPGTTLPLGGNTGRTNVSVVLPKALGPKGFGGNYRLSKGY